PNTVTLRGGRASNRRMRLALGILTVTAVLSGQSQSKEQPFDVQHAKEQALGAQLAQELRSRTTAVETPEVVGLVNREGRRLAAQFDPKIQWKFAVIAEDKNGKRHEPVAFPGGYIFVPEVLVGDATFRFMLAHAMAHVALRHGIKPGTMLAGSPVIFMGGWAG